MPRRRRRTEAPILTDVALSIPAVAAEADDSSPSVPIMTNLDHFMRSVSPLVSLKNLSEDLWESFHEQSVYGVGVPLLLKGKTQLKNSIFPICRGYSCTEIHRNVLLSLGIQFYRIPVVPKLGHLEASFLTFYFLSTQSKNTTNMHGNGDPDDKYTLPVFGLVSQKFRGSMMSSCGTQERVQGSSLLQAVEDWLGQLNVMLSDYRHFRIHDHTR